MNIHTGTYCKVSAEQSWWSWWQCCCWWWCWWWHNHGDDVGTSNGDGVGDIIDRVAVGVVVAGFNDNISSGTL